MASTHLIDTRALRAEFLRLHALLRFAQLEIFYSYKYLKVNYRVLRLHKNIVSLRELAVHTRTDGQMTLYKAPLRAAII